MTINKQNDFKTFIAVDKLDSRVIDKKVYETKTDNNLIMFVIDKNNLDLPRIADYVKRFAEKNKSNINYDLNSFINYFDDSKIKADLILSLVLAATFYEKKPFNLKTTKEEIFEINLILDEMYGDILKEACVVKDAQFFCRALQDMPSNILYPAEFCRRVRELFNEVSYKVNIVEMNKKQIQEQNMGLLLAVNAGSLREPRFMYVEYKNNQASNEYYGYVGKGITFDSGGMNIKTGSFMRWMKFDMSGAAAVMATVYALAKNNIKTNVVGVACLTENLVSPTSVRPDDVIISHSGKTVEIDNTDAEGRLVLADGLSYAASVLNVTKLVDIATLTGAMIFSLGDVYSGVWTSHDNDWREFEKVAFDSGEYVWRMPLHENFLKMLDSDIADMKNSCDDRRGGSSRAACFLNEFTHGKNFIHLDVAITADVNNQGQGVMIKTLYNFAKNQK